MNGHTRGIGEHTAFVVDSESAPQYERVPIIHLRPERVLAGGKIRTSHRGVVGAGPTAESDLQYQGRETDKGVPTQRRLARGYLPRLRVQRQPAQQSQGGEAAQEVRRDD